MRPATRTPWRAAVAIACAAATTFAAAEGAGEIVVEGQDPAIRCLIVPSRAIEYPPDMATFKEGGTVRVRLTFTGGEDVPRAEAFYFSAEQLRSLVLARVEQYRMPCLERGESRTVTQEFRFDPGDGRTIVSAKPRSANPESKTWGCLKVSDTLPAYPRQRAQDDATHGRVLARAEFIAPDAPPQVQILFNGGSSRFERVARSYLATYRLPCMQAADAPLVMTQQFTFRLEGAGGTLLKDASLSAFIGNLAHLENHHVRFDFSTMGCPFKLNFVLRQPHAENVIREIERADPNRREFVEWLRTVDLNVPKRLHDEIVGDSMTISVPCGVLDLH